MCCFMYYLQHEWPCYVGRYKLEPRARLEIDESLEIDEVYAEKIKVKVYLNQQNSVYRHCLKMYFFEFSS